jgi:secondary thiamine-phosphate synthase enzyme
MHREIVVLSSSSREELIDVTEKLRAIAGAHPEAALMALFARGATSAIMIQENWDASVRTDIVACLRQIAPRGKWLHDQQDGNADAHLKSGIVGPSATVPLEGGCMLLGRWQNVFFCDFDGPRECRELIVTLLP